MTEELDEDEEFEGAVGLLVKHLGPMRSLKDGTVYKAQEKLSEDTYGASELMPE